VLLWLGEGQPRSLKPPANERTVRHIDQVGEQSGIHPTQKPVELFVRPIEFHTRRATSSTSPSGGRARGSSPPNGPGRLCYALEQEPRYCDVAKARWESFSGQNATRA
jgi:DNA modification methylase